MLKFIFKIINCIYQRKIERKIKTACVTRSWYRVSINYANEQRVNSSAIKFNKMQIVHRHFFLTIYSRQKEIVIFHRHDRNIKMNFI